MPPKTLENVLSEIANLSPAKGQGKTVKILVPPGLNLSLIHEKAGERGYEPDGADPMENGSLFRYVPRFNGHRELGYYNELQRRMLDFFLHVSCDQKNFGVFSITLASLFLDAASFFDSLAQNLIRERSEAGNALQSAASIKGIAQKLSGKSFFTINDYRECLENEFAFSDKALNLNTYGDNLYSQPVAYLRDPSRRFVIKPFAEWINGKNPDWWDGYNRVKHDRVKNMEYATLGNAIDALGAVLIALCFFYERFMMSGSRNIETFRLLTPCFWKLRGTAMIGQPLFGK